MEPEMTEQNPILEAALAYGRAGPSIYPSPRKDGAAYVKWRTRSTTDAAIITQWRTQWPEALIYLDCGKSEVGVIDADTLEGHDVDGLGALLDLEMANEFLPLTRQAQSPSKGIAMIEGGILPAVRIGLPGKRGRWRAWIG
jgi:Bifunctional DNA primase/polymerase, N-terminal